MKSILVLDWHANTERAAIRRRYLMAHHTMNVRQLRRRWLTGWKLAIADVTSGTGGARGGDMPAAVGVEANEAIASPASIAVNVRFVRRWASVLIMDGSKHDMSWILVAYLRMWQISSKRRRRSWRVGIRRAKLNDDDRHSRQEWYVFARFAFSC